jgi:predicted nucleic acid-binding Zn ribbon protein
LSNLWCKQIEAVKAHLTDNANSNNGKVTSKLEKREGKNGSLWSGVGFYLRYSVRIA